MITKLITEGSSSMSNDDEMEAMMADLRAKAMADPHYHGLGEAYQRYFDEHGIVPERITPEAYSCCIGFSEREQKWYGWSHRAIHGHGIGETVGPGHLAYNEERGTWTAQTLNDAKQMAIDYYRGVA